MTQEEILKAFDNRWRIKEHVFSAENHVQGEIKKLCLDFFKTGILLGEGFSVAEDEQCGTVIYKHDPILDTDDNGFSEWWDMYGKKIDRAKCEKKWEKLSFAEKRACIAATPAYVASTPDLQFRRHPMTYLNNKSWENQIIPRNNGNTKPTPEQQQSKLADILVG
jgi:hypothetical protein